MTSRSPTGGAAKNAAKKTPAKPRPLAKAAAGKAAAAKVTSVKASPAKPGSAKAASKAGPSKRAAAKPGDMAKDAGKVAFRLKDLIERVVATAGVKKKDAKPVIEATLKHLGDALEAGEALILQPLGRIRVNKAKGTASGDMLTVKLKRSANGKPAGKPARQGLAEDTE